MRWPKSLLFIDYEGQGTSIALNAGTGMTWLKIWAEEKPFRARLSVLKFISACKTCARYDCGEETYLVMEDKQLRGVFGVKRICNC